MESKNKAFRIIARIFGMLNALSLLILYLTLFQFSELLPQRFANNLINNLELVLYLAYAFLLISIIFTLIVKQRSKQEKYNVFFLYLALTSINLIALMHHIALITTSNPAPFG